jgi:hypothetical protein
MPARRLFETGQGLLEILRSTLPTRGPRPQLTAHHMAFGAAWIVVERHPVQSEKGVVVTAQSEQGLYLEQGALAGQGTLREKSRMPGQQVESGRGIVLAAQTAQCLGE